MSIEEDRELDRVLRVLDEDTELSPGQADRIWDRIQQRRNRRRHLRLAVAAAAAAALIVIGVVTTATVRDDDAVDVATDDRPGEVLEPCETFRTAARSPQVLRTLLLAGAVEPSEITASVTALEKLQEDLLETRRVDDGDRTDRDLDQIAGSLRQATTSLEADDTAAALRALDFAINRYEQSELEDRSCLG